MPTTTVHYCQANDTVTVTSRYADGEMFVLECQGDAYRPTRTERPTTWARACVVGDDRTVYYHRRPDGAGFYGADVTDDPGYVAHRQDWQRVVEHAANMVHQVATIMANGYDPERLTYRTDV